MRLTNYLLIGLLTCAAGFAQGLPGPGRDHFGPGGPGGPGFGPRGGKVVTGAPYSADVSFSRTETLSDGNTIQQSATGKRARDAQGRTYSMETFTGGPLGQTEPTTRISIIDPVAGYAYELNPTAKTATRRSIHQPREGAAFKGPRPDTNRPAPPDLVKTDLGAQTVAGLNATGTKSTRTIPAGAMGNALPIVSTTETWYSSDLQTVISSTHDDPRAGHTTYTLTNIQRAAPDASLFQVPSGYTVTDAARGGRGGFDHPGPPPEEE